MYLLLVDYLVTSLPLWVILKKDRRALYDSPIYPMISNSNIFIQILQEANLYSPLLYLFINSINKFHQSVSTAYK